MPPKKKKEPPPAPPLDLPEAPVFTPTAEEWRNPLKYISEVVRPVVEHTAGICRVVPPGDWVAGLAAEFAIDRSMLKFTARVQRVDQLQRKHTAVASQRFWNEYGAWMAANNIKRKGGKLNPVFNGQEIELDRLHAVVARRGGYEAVTEDKAWREIANVLDLEDKAGNAAFTLRKLYEKLLQPFDDHSYKRAEGGYGLLDAAMSAQASANKLGQLAGAGVDEDEAAEILSAMLGLTPPDSKKKRKSAAKAGGKDGKDGAGTSATAAKERLTTCSKCGGGHMPEKLVPCDRCNKGWHLFCLAPPVAAPPQGNWVCPDCRTKEFEAFAFQDTDDYTLKEFEQVAATFEEQWFGAEAVGKLSDKEKEAKFWRIVEDGEDVVEVLYGADLDSGEVGSGFPRAPPLSDSDSSYATHPWNLSVLPRQGGRYSSLLRVLDGNIAGVTVPWVYVGMCFSSFCWHVEDHMLYSINYNHWGAAKQWYGVPAWAAAKFEAVFRAELADQIEAQPDLLFQLLSMLSPRVLQMAGVPVYSSTQAAGEFVITFPNAYHGGFCLGVNLGEAVNFAPPDWLRFGAVALSRLRHFRKPCVISQEELLLRVAAQQAGGAVAAALSQRPGQQAGEPAANGAEDAGGAPGGPAAVASPTAMSPLVCYYLHQELRRVVEEEWVLRAKLWSEGLRRSRRTELAVGFQQDEKDDTECAICHVYMHLSAVECDCCQGRRVCLHHVNNLCGCHMNKRRLVYRHSLSQLEAVQSAVEARVPAALAAELDAVEAVAAARTAAAMGAAVKGGAICAGPKVKQEPEEEEEEQQRRQQVERQESTAVEVKVKEVQHEAAASTCEGDKATLSDLPARMAHAAQQGQQDGGQQQGEQRPPTADAAVGGQAPGAGPAIHAPPLHLQANVSQQDGPVHPFASVDSCHWDRAELPEWCEALKRACQQWQQDAAEVLEQGGDRAEHLQDLAEECEQYLWGDASPEVVALAARVQVAAVYMERINAALKGKQGLEEVEAIIAEDPKPIPNPPGLLKLVEGLEAARDWLQRAAAFLDECHMVELKSLEVSANEANRLLVALPEAKVLRERVTAARKLADTVRAALPARELGRRRAEQMELGELRGLQGQAAELRVDMPELNSLAIALERVDVWQSRVRALTEMQAPLSELRELAEEADALPAAMPEVEGIKTLIERGEAWKAQMEGLVRSSPSLKKMRECLGVGVRLAVELPEVEALRWEIRRREWEDSARRLLSSRQNTLVALSELVATAVQLGTDDTPLVQELRSKVEAAEAWEARAAELLERQAERLPEEERPTLEEVHRLVAEGFATGIRMDRLAQLNSQLTFSLNWMEEARATLAKAAVGGPQVAAAMEVDKEEHGEEQIDSMPRSAAVSPRGTPEPETLAVAVLLVAAEAEAEAEAGEQQQPQWQRQRQASTTTPTSLLPLLPAIPKPRRRGRHPKSKKNKQGRSTGGLPELSVIEQLLADYRSLLVRAVEEAEGLRKLRSVADGWLEEARPVLEQDFVTDNQLGLLGGLIASGEQLGLAMDQLEILKANAEALLWARKVRALLEKIPDSQQQEQQQPVAVETVVVVETEQQAEAAVAEVLERLLHAVEVVEEGQQQCKQPEAASAVALVSFEQRPSLSEASALLEEGYILPCDEKLYARLQSLVKVGQEFEARSAHILALGRDGISFAHVIEADVLEPMLATADRLCLKLESLPVLERMLAAFRKWEAELRALTLDASGAAAKPSFAALQAASQAARVWPITSPLRVFADEAFQKTGDWMERCRKILAKRNTGARLDACLATVSASVDAAVQQFERRLDAEKKVVAAGGSPTTLQPPVPSAEDERELYCLCQRPFNSNSSMQGMVSCDTCKELYHARCVGVSLSLMRATKRYTCPICTAVKGNTEPLEQAVAKLQRTKRPERDELAALLPELKMLPVQPEEGELLETVIKRFDRWGTATNRAVEVHEMSNSLGMGGPQVLPLSDVMLHALLKSSMAMEIDAMEYADKVLRLLRGNRWRARVELAIAPPAKMGPEGVQKLVQEAEDLGINLGKDIVGNRLQLAITVAKDWAVNATACLRDLKVEGSTGDPAKFEEVAARAQQLAKEGLLLGVKMGEQVERLQEHAKRYCLCRRPYNEDQAMVGCDFCQDWYHHKCVGLEVPGTQGGGG